jgi:hypothetical protein
MTVIAWAVPVGESRQRFGDRPAGHGGPAGSHPLKLAWIADRP